MPLPPASGRLIDDFTVKWRDVILKILTGLCYASPVIYSDNALLRGSPIQHETLKGNPLAQRLYECMFLLDSSKYAQDPQGTENAVNEMLQRCEAEIAVQQPWQEGKLAYEMDGHRKGLHYLTYFRMDGSQVDAFARMCKLSDVVIRHLLLEHEEKLFNLLTQHISSDGETEDEEGGPAIAETAPAAE